jgi:hypothetical protein
VRGPIVLEHRAEADIVPSAAERRRCEPLL